MEGSEQDKSEQPTPFKLNRARRKGSVARGLDLGFFTSLSAFLGFMWIMGPHWFSELSFAMRGALARTGSVTEGDDGVLSAAALLFSSVMAPIAVMAGAIFAVVLLFELLQTGFVFSAEPLKPNFSRLNPAKGLKRLFSVRLLIETLKNVLKLGAYAAAGYFVVRDAVYANIGAIADGHGLLVVMGKAGLRLLMAFALLAFAFAVLDQLIVRRDFLKKMRMSRRELRREMREREGEPRLKQKRKQLHAEFTKNRQSLRNIRKADVLITNPEHLALALRYEMTTMPAPLIVSVGTNSFAQRLKRLAFIYGVPIVENRTLAHELYRKAGLNRYVPDHCFKPVADIYNSIRRKQGASEHA